MESRKLAVIGVGNMARSIICGIVNAGIDVSEIILFDKNTDQYNSLTGTENYKFSYANSISDAVEDANCVLLSVKPQNYNEVLSEIATIDGCDNKLYISIAAGITVDFVSKKLKGARVVRVLPNVPMLIGQGVSVICENNEVSQSDFSFVCDVFKSAGNVTVINESEMNRIIGVTSSSPAYVFKFINAIYKGAIDQGLEDNDLINTICDMVIGSAMLMKNSPDSPDALIARVASKGGTTERALKTLDDFNFDTAISDAMKACTARADELGRNE